MKTPSEKCPNIVVQNMQLSGIQHAQYYRLKKALKLSKIWLPDNFHIAAMRRYVGTLAIE